MDEAQAKFFKANSVKLESITELPDGSFDVDAFVNIWQCTTPNIPVKLRRVTGFEFSKLVGPTITSLENCPDIVDSLFDVSRMSLLISLKHFPKEVGDCYLPNGFLNPSDYRYVLLAKVRHEVNISGGNFPIVANVIHILSTGRVNGVIPSELMPGKIKQLRELDGL